MTIDAFHPDHLKPGDMVGPWQIVESLGSGNFGHAFKAELAGESFTLKIAVRPAPGLSEDTSLAALEEGQVDGRMRHEGAVLLANMRGDGLPHLRAVGRWPHPKRGYLFLVTDYVPGEPFHDWRERTHPTAAQLVDIFIAVVRVVARLHRRGILIRDFKSEHVIVPADHKPVLVDLGSAWLPGGSSLTVGLAPSTPHTLPPECIAFLREGSWRQGTRFDSTQAGDLYQVGVFMYEALTDAWPFNPRLPGEELRMAIESVIPRPPHRINPNVPETLSRIVLRLLEKRPEDRYESADVLLQALWEANKERSTKAWKVPLSLPPEGPAPVTQEEVEERRLLLQESERRAQDARAPQAKELSREQALEQLSILTQEIEEQLLLAEEKAARRKRWWRRGALTVGAFMLALTLFVAGWEWFSPIGSTAPTEKGISPMLTTLSNSRPVRAVAAWLCATVGVGCTAAQVRPMPGDCPQEAVQSMEQLDLLNRHSFRAVIDINQPGDSDQQGLYSAGKMVGRVVKYEFTGPLPDGTLLYGQLWTEGLTKEGSPAVLGRYTELLLPDGRRFPVCFVMGDWTTGLTLKFPGSPPDQVILPREMSVTPVRIWP
ncbi:serine/threonine protein kinase [Hyalangium gracile]|uniref:serine/threonine protein kinase n=1 Tax=Hyalangium gracile TaxID=394092 RepID=UPI001CCBDF1E|nr:protein kinase [Hyalangium gracile]